MEASKTYEFELRIEQLKNIAMGLSKDTQNCGLRTSREHTPL